MNKYSHARSEGCPSLRGVSFVSTAMTGLLTMLRRCTDEALDGGS